jgi:hypothetical protein
MKSRIFTATIKERHIMIPILLFLGLSLSANLVLADMSPMAEKHIFTPDNIGEPKEEGPPAPVITASALEKEIRFTGVLISAKGKSVILTENAKKDKNGLKHVLMQGDQIKGMTIQEIGSNFVLLAGKDNTRVKMNLYKGAKTRPAPVLAEAKPEMPTLQAPPGAPKTEKTPDAQPPGTTAVEKEMLSPFGGSSKGNAPQQQSGEAPANPFADVLNKASQQNQAPIPTNAFNQLPLPLNQ